MSIEPVVHLQRVTCRLQFGSGIIKPLNTSHGMLGGEVQIDETDEDLKALAEVILQKEEKKEEESDLEVEVAEQEEEEGGEEEEGEEEDEETEEETEEPTSKRVKFSDDE
uniref:Putative upheld n=1 Tax=Ixodes ricinus TaxID=34613 RepID=A0A0K8R4M6_IXORI